MPTLAITDGLGHPLDLAPIIVLAATQWPNDGAARATFIEHYRALIAACALAENCDERDLIESVVDAAFKATYRDLPRMVGITTTGQILREVFKLAQTDPKHASINHVMKALLDKRSAGAATEEHPPRMRISKRRLWDIWRDWKSAAHLCAAFCDWVDDRRGRSDDSLSLLDPTWLDTLPNFLFRAEEYRIWGEAHESPKRRNFRKAETKPILDSATTWKPPDDLKLAISLLDPAVSLKN